MPSQCLLSCPIKCSSAVLTVRRSSKRAKRSLPEQYKSAASSYTLLAESPCRLLKEPHGIFVAFETVANVCMLEYCNFHLGLRMEDGLCRISAGGWSEMQCVSLWLGGSASGWPALTHTSILPAARIGPSLGQNLIALGIPMPPACRQRLQSERSW